MKKVYELYKIPIHKPGKLEKIAHFVFSFIGITLIIIGIINLFANFMTHWILLIGLILWIIGIYLGREIHFIKTMKLPTNNTN